ncbi:MAG: DNA-binding response OmpR family regulator [Myxococcota bacterium]|jgi:DNA-binding response OmpR family regulator
MSGSAIVLIIDDDPLIRKLFRLTLTREGYHIEEAANCAEAKAKVIENPPHLVLTDLRLPDGRGVALATWIRSQPGMADIPILAISGVEGMTRASASLKDLFADFFLKPIASSVLKTAIAQYLSPTTSETADPLINQYKTARDLTRRATHRHDQLVVLASMTEVISRTTDLEAVLGEGLERYLDAGGFSLGAVYLWNHEIGIQLTGQAGCPPALLPQLNDLFGHPEVLFEALEAPDALILPDQDHHPELLAASGFASMLLVPMVAEQELLGVLLLASDQEGFAREGVAFGRSIQSQITLAVVLAAVQAQRDVFWRAFQRIADTSPVGVVTHRADEMEYLNPAARRLLGGMQGYHQLKAVTPEEGTAQVAIRQPNASLQHLWLSVQRYQDRFGVRYEHWLLEEASGPSAESA